LRPIDGYEPGKPLTVEQGKFLADYWSGLLDASLADLGTDHVYAYYLMGVGEPEVVRCEALHEAFLKAKQAGKVGHWGVSTHKNAQQVLEAVVETDWYDLAMIAITPAGWYDWDSKSLLPGTPAMVELQPTLQRARDAGIGLVGMKAARYLSSRGGAGTENAFDGHYSDAVKQSGLSPWQRSYAFVLAHGVDVVNSDMQNFAHFKENLAAVQRSAELFAKA
jgi:aryl-alcohol dehydrogenase-like predicted oxidoreductase